MSDSEWEGPVAVKESANRRAYMFIAAFGVIVVGALAILATLYWNLIAPLTPTPTLTGGTRLVYRIDYDGALERRDISDSEFADREHLLKETLGIIRKRTDSRRMRGVHARIDEEGRIVVECSWEANSPTFVSELALAAELPDTANLLSVEIPEPGDFDGRDRLRGFPIEGGVLLIGQELVRYTRRVRNEFRGLERGYASTSASEHVTGSIVALESTNRVRRLIENTGQLELYLVADPEQEHPQRMGEGSEREKLEAWLIECPDESISAFNATRPEDGGPSDGVRWYPHRLDDSVFVEHGESRLERTICVVRQAGRWRFTEEDIAGVELQQDYYGDPEISIEWDRQRQVDLDQWAGIHVGEELAIVLNDEIFGVVTICEDLSDRCAVSGGPGGLSVEDVAEVLARILRSGRLPVRAELVLEEPMAESPEDG